MIKLNDNRGDAAVLITILFACLIGLTAVLVSATKVSAGRSCADAAFRIAGRSILSEYDTKLYKDYGLLAFKGDEAQIEKDIGLYSDATISKKASSYLRFFPSKGTRMLDMDASVTANLKQFSLMDTNIFEKQLVKAAPKKILTGSKSKGYGETKGDPPKNRVLRNADVKKSLPSANYSKPGFFDIGLSDIPKLKTMLSSAANSALTDEYILSAFGHANDGVYSEKRFFANEAEYILCGKDNDKSNYSQVKIYLALLRDLMNNAALLADGKKRTIVIEAAAPFAAAAGIGELVAAAIIVESWVAAETRNDLMILEEGGNVAFMKSPSQWATNNIKQVLDGAFSSTPDYPINKSGMSYRDYLRCFLFLMNREEKLLRIMDLIQINLKTDYDRDFLLREYYTGFRFTPKVGGDKFDYTENY